MQSLKKIEALPPARRSSMVGQSGVLSELRALDKEAAINWLQRNISSPVTRDWGKLLAAVSASWPTLKAWMHIDKEHALAAADAIDYQISTQEEWPEEVEPNEVIAELERVTNLYQTPKLKSILDSAIEFSKPIALTEELRAAATLLFGKNEPNIFLRDNGIKEKWHTLFHKANNKYCLTILDWRSSETERNNALSSLPIMVNPKSTHLLYAKVDIGSDEIIFIALPETEIETLKKLSPKSFKYEPYNGAA